MFQVGDLVKAHPAVLTNEALGFEPAKISGLLVINELDGTGWFGMQNYEVKNSDGEVFGLLETSLVAV